MHSEADFAMGKNCPFMTNNKNLGKRIQKSKPYMYNTQEHNESFIPLGSNIQFSTNTEKE